MPDAFHHADDILENQIDPLAAKLAKAHPDFYAKYQAARVIVDRPGGHASPGNGNNPPPPAPPITPPAAPSH